MDGYILTETERQRLDELDNIIAWQLDGGRALTEEEQQEHTILATKLLKEGELKGYGNKEL